jgi:hypothetical protein
MTYILYRSFPVCKEKYIFEEYLIQNQMFRNRNLMMLKIYHTTSISRVEISYNGLCLTPSNPMTRFITVSCQDPINANDEESLRLAGESGVGMATPPNAPLAPFKCSPMTRLSILHLH